MAGPDQLPPLTTTTASGGQVLAVGPAVRVACFGDSVMWGQGLTNPDKFKTLIAQALSVQLKKTAGITYDGSRSGAAILGSASGRADFVDTYPELFPNGTGLNAFKANSASDGVGKDETPAWGLYGEVPSTYPTISAQVDLLSAADGRNIDYVLMDGGINDAGPEDIVNPQVHDGAYIENYDGVISDIAYTRVLELLTRVRSKCPNAVIFYFGFYPVMSYDSNTSKIRDFFQHEFNDDFQWWFNEYIYEVTDINRLINQGQNRALWLHGRWQYWTRQAVAAANYSDVGEPGVLYVPSGFAESNAVYANRPYLWQDYKDPTTDPAQATRVARIPRNKYLDLMVQLAGLLPIGPSIGEPTAEASTLDAAIEGPLALKRELRDYNSGDHDGARDGLTRELKAEVHRIQHGHIASLSHPNVAGALHWAGLAMERHNRHRDTLARIVQETTGGAVGPATLDAQLRRYNLRTGRGLAADAGHLEVDSLCLRVTTAEDSEQNLAEPVYLAVHTKDPNSGITDTLSYLLTFRPYIKDSLFIAGIPAIKPYPYFEPGAVNRLTVATDGDLILTDIVGCAIVLGEDPYKGKKMASHYGVTWRPETVALEINGREVVRLTPFGQAFGPGQQLDLGWPGPAPAAPKPLKAVLPRQVLARPLAKKVVAQMESRIQAQRAARHI